MESYLLEWAHVLLRCLHVATAMVWIGSSFFFVWLDNSLVPADGDGERDLGVTGSLWMLYGGAFYNVRKFPLGPRRGAVSHLHWLYWESYATWLSGLALLIQLYFWQADTMLADPALLSGSGPMAGLAAWGFIVVGWLGYEGLCRMSRIASERRLVWWMTLWVLFADWLACQWFPGRAAFLLVGAMLGTIMTANIFFWVIPGQRETIEQILGGQVPQSLQGQRSKVRSLHNTYFALPVLVVMLLHHNPMLSRDTYNWVVLAVLMLMAVLVRHFFVMRHKGRVRWELWVWVCVLWVGLVAWIAP
jgi:uncharacterized membrane protein